MSAASSSIPRLMSKFRAREISKVLPARQKDSSNPIQIRNPFVPFFNPTTKRWAPPLYSRRRQQELIKAARASNTLHLLPTGTKMGPTEFKKELDKQRERLANQSAQSISPTSSSLSEEVRSGRLSKIEVEWVGEVKEKVTAGVDIGVRLYAGKKRMFKGHKWEREREKRKGQIRIRMRHMQNRIQRFKSTYKRRRPNPLADPKPRKKEKLPF